MKFTLTAVLLTLASLALAREGTYLENVPATGGIAPIKARALEVDPEGGLDARGYTGKCPSVFGWCPNNGMCCLTEEWCCSFGCCPNGYSVCGNDHLCYPDRD